MPTTPAFPFISLDPRRSLKKPRAAGLTMVSDYQLGMIALQDLLDVGGDYMDIFKVATGTARLFERGHLIAKLELLGHHSVRSLLGGQFQEYVLHTMGMDAFPRHLEEASAVGFDLIEISDNVVDLGPGTRERLFDAVRAAGLTPVGEIGDKREHSAAQAIVAEVQEVLGLGAELALIEGAELMLDGQPNEDLILTLKREVEIDRCMFELATPRVGSTAPQIYAAKKFLIKTFGPDVNLGNVTPDVVIETETTRLGLGSAGPLDLM